MFNRLHGYYNNVSIRIRIKYLKKITVILRRVRVPFIILYNNTLAVVRVPTIRIYPPLVHADATNYYNSNIRII